MKNGLPPYEGTGQFVYLCASVTDEEWVGALADRLISAGIRIWHDEKIRSYEADWKRITRIKLDECNCVLLILTKQFAMSHICREKWTAALQAGKAVLVLPLEEVALSVGMKRQLEASLQLQYQTNLAEMMEVLLEHPLLIAHADDACSDLPVRNWPMDKYSSEMNDESLNKTVRRPVEDDPSEKTVLELRRRTRYTGKADPQEKKFGASDPDATIVTGQAAGKGQMGDPDATIETRMQKQQVFLPVVLSMATGEMKKGMRNETIVGRESTVVQNASSDIQFRDATKMLSRRHFAILELEEARYIRCLHNNGLSVNGIGELHNDERYELDSDICTIQIPGNRVLENAVNSDSITGQYVIAFGTMAGKLWQQKTAATLTSVETSEIRFIQNNNVELGRSTPWISGAMASKTIGRKHAGIHEEQGVWYLINYSSNGTVINGRRFFGNEKIVLHNGDRITFTGNEEMGIPDESLIFRCVEIV